MKTTKIILTVLISCFQQILPIYCIDLPEIWELIDERYPNDLDRIHEIYNELKAEKQVFDHLGVTIRQELIAKNAKILFDAISLKNVTASETKLKEIYKVIKNDYDNDIVDGILAEAMNQIALKDFSPLFPELLWQKYPRNDSELFELTLHMELKFYIGVMKIYSQTANLNFFLEKFSFILYKIRNNNLYNRTDPSLRSSVENVIDSLPDNLKYLFFKPHLCLKSALHWNYIYTSAYKILKTNYNYVKLWTKNKENDDSAQG